MRPRQPLRYAGDVLIRHAKGSGYILDRFSRLSTGADVKDIGLRQLRRMSLFTTPNQFWSSVHVMISAPRRQFWMRMSAAPLPTCKQFGARPRVMIVTTRHPVLMDEGTAALSGCKPTLRLCVKNVFPLRSEEEMVRPNARAVIAFVTDKQAAWDRPMRQLPRNTVCHSRLPTEGDAAIAALLGDSSAPYPTAITLQDLPGKPLFKRDPGASEVATARAISSGACALVSKDDAASDTLGLHERPPKTFTPRGRALLRRVPTILPSFTPEYSVILQ